MRGVQCALLGLPWTLHTHSPASSSCRSNSARGAFPLWHPHPGAGPSSVAMHKAHAAVAMPKGPLCALLSPGLAAGHRALPGFSPLRFSSQQAQAASGSRQTASGSGQMARGVAPGWRLPGKGLECLQLKSTNVPMKRWHPQALCTPLSPSETQGEAAGKVRTPSSPQAHCPWQ